MYTVDNLVYITIYVLEIQLVNRFQWFNFFIFDINKNSTRTRIKQIWVIFNHLDTTSGGWKLWKKYLGFGFPSGSMYKHIHVYINMIKISGGYQSIF